jgi:hypothetical protein
MHCYVSAQSSFKATVTHNKRHFAVNRQNISQQFYVISTVYASTVRGLIGFVSSWKFEMQLDFSLYLLTLSSYKNSLM